MNRLKYFKHLLGKFDLGSHKRRPCAAILAVSFATLLLAMISGGTIAAAEVAIPELPGYDMPTNQFPLEQSAWAGVIDLIVLTVGLTLATIFTFWLRRRRALWLLAIAALVYFGFYRHGCICAIGSIQNVALAIADTSYTIPITAIGFFSLPILFSLLFGRVFCGSICPLGAMQELVIVRAARIPRQLVAPLSLLRYVYLGLAILLAVTGTAFIICRYDPFIGLMRLGGSPGMLIFGGVFLLLGTVIARPYCRFLCPYGAILGLCSKVAWKQTTIAPRNDCIDCKFCDRVCPVDAIDRPSSTEPEESRRTAGRRLMLLMLVLPVIAIAGAGVGRLLALPLAETNRTVQLAQHYFALYPDQAPENAAIEIAAPKAAEPPALNKDETEAIDAFRDFDGDAPALYERAVLVYDRMKTGSTLFGLFIGLVIGAKLIHLSIRRRRGQYTIDAADCVNCGRCYESCPKQWELRGHVLPVELHTGDR